MGQSVSQFTILSVSHPVGCFAIIIGLFVTICLLSSQSFWLLVSCLVGQLTCQSVGQKVVNLFSK